MVVKLISEPCGLEFSPTTWHLGEMSSTIAMDKPGRKKQ